MAGRQRLLGKHIQPGAPDAPASQRLDQRGLIRDFPSGHVDQHRRGLHRRQRMTVDHVARLRRQRHVQRHVVRLREYRIQFPRRRKHFNPKFIQPFPWYI